MGCDLLRIQGQICLSLNTTAMLRCLPGETFYSLLVSGCSFLLFVSRVFVSLVTAVPTAGIIFIKLGLGATQ